MKSDTKLIIRSRGQNLTNIIATTNTSNHCMIHEIKKSTNTLQLVFNNCMISVKVLNKKKNVHQQRKKKPAQITFICRNLQIRNSTFLFGLLFVFGISFFLFSIRLFLRFLFLGQISFESFDVFLDF